MRVGGFCWASDSLQSWLAPDREFGAQGFAVSFLAGSDLIH
jgi:hypothetical protein